MRRWIVRLSFALNLVVLLGGLVLFVSLPGLIDRYLLQPNRERLISQRLRRLRELFIVEPVAGVQKEDRR